MTDTAQCPTPGCVEAALRKRRFCAEHLAQLDRIRRELEREMRIRASDALGRLGKPVELRECCTPGCTDKVVAPRIYCAPCSEAQLARSDR